MNTAYDPMDKLIADHIAEARDLRLHLRPAYAGMEHEFSVGFENKMGRLTNKHNRLPLKFLITAATIAALTMTAGAEVLPPVRAFRSGVVHVLSQVFPKSTDQIYTTDADHEGETRRPVLGWLPEGMTQTDRTELTNSTLLTFENADGDRLSIYIKRITEGSANTSSFDTEDAAVTEIEINGITATISVKKETAVLIYFIDNYRCSISGSISADNLIKIAENIELK